jgi:uncharacterized protein YqcC (DUF446 family)
MEIYSLASLKADEIEVELKRLDRWTANPLPDEAFKNMGAFGSNTMSFEQWLQFVLIPRIRQIVEEKSEFPEGSNLATYAIRYFDGDSDSDSLREVLYNLDELINKKQNPPVIPAQPFFSNPVAPTVSIGDTNIPAVLYSIAEVLPQFELKDLESQLQTFDTFLSFLSPTVRPEISAMLTKAAEQITNPECKKRIEQAANDVAEGRRAAPPYNHEGAMKKYQEEHFKNFPPQSN